MSCRHKVTNQIVVQIVPHIQSIIGHVCVKCGAVKNSVDLHAKYKMGDSDTLISELAAHFQYPMEWVKVLDHQANRDTGDATF